VPANRNLRFLSENGFFELQRQIFAEIRAALRPGAATTASEQVPEPEEIPEDVVEILERAGIESAHAGTGYPGVAEAIIGSALIGIG